MDFERFKSVKSSSNICEQAFKPTCNKDRIFSKIKDLEEKIDELEYDIYQKNRDKRNIQKKEAEARGRMTANKIKARQVKRREMITKQIKQERAGPAARQMEKERKQAIQNKKRVNAGSKSFDDNRIKRLKRNRKNWEWHKNPWPAKGWRKGYSMQTSGTGEDVDDMSGNMNKQFKDEDVEDKDELDEAVTDVDMPSGFVL
jgi:outer membrane murein-binding lipoprotein Lpp